MKISQRHYTAEAKFGDYRVSGEAIDRHSINLEYLSCIANHSHENIGHNIGDILS